MIEINSRSGRGFPVVDFKFHNAGHVAAVMWKFAIELESAEVDRTPEINGWIEVDRSPRYTRANRLRRSRTPPADLKFNLLNEGWGSLRRAQVVVSEPVLDQLVPKEARTFEVELLSGKANEFAIKHDDVDRAQFSRLLADQIDRDRVKALEDRDKFLAELAENMKSPELFRNHYYVGLAKEQSVAKAEMKAFRSRYLNRKSAELKEIATQTCLRVGIPVVKMYGADEAGVDRNYEFNLRIGPYSGSLTVGPEGFIAEEHQVRARYLPSDTTYCTVLNLGGSPKIRREYKISRQVPAGDAERFQIMVGADRSALLRVRFVFYLEDGMTVSSGVFDLKVWNPIGSRLHRRYPDGLEVFNQSQAGQLQGCDLDEWVRANASFPFVSVASEGSPAEDLEIPSFLRRLAP